MLALLLVAAAASGTPPPAPGTGAWVVTKEVSQLDGSRFYSAVLASTNQTPNTIGSPDSSHLVVRCDKGEVAAYVTWAPFMGSDDREVRWKFDDGPIWKQNWPGSASGTGTFARNPEEFIGSIGKAKRLVVDAVPYQSTNAEAVFDLEGADEVANDALTACGKKAP